MYAMTQLRGGSTMPQAGVRLACNGYTEHA